jgi:hypothetical protein
MGGQKMIKKVSCKVINSKPLKENIQTTLTIFRNSKSNNTMLKESKAKAKLYFDNGLNWQDFNCRA